MKEKLTGRTDNVLTKNEKSLEKAAFALASIEKAGEAIFWVDKNAHFVEVNEAGCRHLGYDKNEILALTVFDVNPYFPRERWPDLWKEIRDKKSLSFEVLHKQKSGRLFPAELRLNHIKIGEKEYNFVFATDITERKSIENAMSDLSKGIYSAIGEDYFVMVVQYLTKALNADFVYVAEFVGNRQSRARTLALMADGRLIDNVEVDLSGTPCETVVGRDVCSYPSKVQELFPSARMMADLGVHAYIGSTLDDSKGRHLGLLTVMFRNPVEHTETIESVLKIFAARTSAELERRRAENDLLESEEKYRNIFENSSIGITVCGESGQCIVANEALAEIIGGSVEEVRNQNFFQLESWRQSGLFDSAKEVFHIGKKKRKIFRTVTTFGRLVWLDVVFVPYNEKGEKFIMILVEDVTERKLAEADLINAHSELEKRVRERTAALQKTNKELEAEISRRIITEKSLSENEEKFRKLTHEFNTLLDAIPDRLILLSPTLEILWSNRAFDLAMDVKRERDEFCYRTWFDRSSPCENCPVMKSFLSGKEETARVADSQGRIFDKRAFPILDETGAVGSVIEVSRDVTERIRMEEEAKLVQTRLIHANKMTSLGTLVSGVAHEINNPNSYIMSNAEMFREIWKDAIGVLRERNISGPPLHLGGISFTDLVELTPKLLEGIRDGSVRIKKIIENLARFGKPDIADLEGEVDIEKTICSALAVLDHQVRKLACDLAFECEQDLPAVKGSASQIEQVFMNLIMNSLQSLTGGGAGISISAYYDEAEKMVVVRVRDEGVGIPGDILPNISDPFFTTRHEKGGTGLGLSISYAIIKTHKGELQFDSKVGAGTTVTVKLPVG